MQPLVHVVDDDAAIRDSIRLLLGSTDMEAACYATAKEFLDATGSIARPGCIMLDLRMPRISGLELQAALGKRHRHLPVIFMSSHGDVDTTVRAMRQGAADFLTKPVNDELLLETIHTAIDRSERQRVAYNNLDAIQDRLNQLSVRERQVLEGVYDGLSNREVAEQLRISHKTVELHRSNMMTKMHAASLAELVRMRMMVESAPTAVAMRQGG